MSLKIDQAFLQAYTNGNFGLEIADQNEPFDPTAGTPYAELINAPNPITYFGTKHYNETSGVFRIILRYPLNQGAVDAKTKAEEIMAYFPVRSRVTYEGQSARVTSVSRQPGVPEDGWYKVVVTIRYIAIIER